MEAVAPMLPGNVEENRRETAEWCGVQSEGHAAASHRERVIVRMVHHGASVYHRMEQLSLRRGDEKRRTARMDHTTFDDL